MAITRQQIVDALDANLNDMYQDGLTSWNEEYRTIFNVLNSTRQSEVDSYESGFAAMPEKNEGVAATYDTILPGISKTYTHVTYALNKLGVLKRNFEVIKRAISVEALWGNTEERLLWILN